MRQDILLIDQADKICKYFFHKYRDFWNFRGCNYYSVDNGKTWCLKKDGVILAVNRSFLTVWHKDYVKREKMEIYAVPKNLLEGGAGAC